MERNFPPGAETPRRVRRSIYGKVVSHAMEPQE
jgi:hypothetical protein